MKHIFEQLRQNGHAEVDRLIASGQQEGVSLEFKEKRDATNGQLTREDRQVLAENLSAFANSAGGLLIFGVEARKNAEQVDAAVAPKPIMELARFHSEVTSAVGDLLLPRHEGIEVLPIPLPAQTAGFLAIWVERSERRPHQSQAAKDRRYYKRSGDNTFVMEHYDIEDAFRRVVLPDLQLSQRIENAGGQGGGEGTLRQYRVLFSLRNTALVTARFPYLHFTELHGLYLPRLSKRGLRYRFQGGRHCFDGGADDIIHPDQDVDIGALEFGILTNGGYRWLVDLSSHLSVERMKRTPLHESRVAFGCQFGAENCRMLRRHDSVGLENLPET